MISKMQEGTYFNGYGGKPSSTNIQKMIRSIRLEKAFRNTGIAIKDVAKELNAKLRGWINYYGLFNKYHLCRVTYRVDYRLIQWIKKKHKVGLRKATAKLRAIKQDDPKLFYHWEVGICLTLQ